MGKVGKRVENLAQLRELANRRKSVICSDHPAFAKPKPAAFVLAFQGRYLADLFDRGIYEYTPGKDTDGDQNGSEPVEATAQDQAIENAREVIGLRLGMEIHRLMNLAGMKADAGNFANANAALDNARTIYNAAAALGIPLHLSNYMEEEIRSDRTYHA